MRRPVLLCLGTEEWFESLREAMDHHARLFLYGGKAALVSHGDGVIFMPGWAKAYTPEQREDFLPFLAAYGRDCGYRGIDIND